MKEGKVLMNSVKIKRFCANNSSKVKCAIRTWIILVLFSVICGLAGMYIQAGYYFEQGDKRGKYSIDSSDIQASDSIEYTGESYVIDKDGGKIVLDIPRQYISKLTYEYSSVGFSDCKVKIFKNNIFGIEEEEVQRDKYMQEMPRSVLNIYGDVSKVELCFGKNDNILEIKNFTIDNSFKVNPLVGIFLTCSTFLIGFLFVFRRKNVLNIAKASFVMIIVVSTCLLLLEPPYIVGWDEQIHYKSSYILGESSTVDTTSNTSQKEEYLYNYAPLINEYSIRAQEPIEERIDEIRVFESMTNNKGSVDGYSLSLNSIGYVFQTLFLKIANGIGVNNYFVWLIGKFSNILLYALVMSLCIGIVPVGKRLLLVVSLLPTMVFQSTTYTYDVTVIVFVTLGICIFVREVICKKEKFNYRYQIIYLIAMLMGCMPKAVYAPLVFAPLLLPKDKFYTDKNRRIFKGACIALFIGLMMTFVLPTILSPSEVGDARGGNTSEAGQMEYVLGQPIRYAIILVKNVVKTAPDYLMGGDMLCNFAYLGMGSLSVLYSAFVLGVILTDTYGSNKYSDNVLPLKIRISSIIQIGITVALIWTALYISYSEVGVSEIAGVQARYYLPFIFLFYLCLQNRKIKNNISEERYQLFVSLISILLIMQQIFQLVLLKTL